MSDIAVAKYLPDGNPDPSFIGDGKRVVRFTEGSSGALGVAVDSQDRIVAVGFVTVDDDVQCAFVRLNPNGELDTTFSDNGKARSRFVEGPSTATGVAIDREGRIVACGRVATADGLEFAVVRLRPDGRLDASFSGNGKVRTGFKEGSGFALGISIDNSGRIVVAGFVDVGNPGHVFALVRYRDDGSLDPTFSKDGKLLLPFQGRDEAFSVRHDARQRIVVAGESRVGGSADAAVTRLRPDGTLDVTFGVNGRAYSDLGGRRAGARGVAIDGQDRIVLAGLTRRDLDQFGVARLLTSGDHDQTFSGDGRALSGFFDTDGAEGVAVDQSSRVVAAGYTGSTSDGTVFALSRFLADGRADQSFGIGGQVFTNFVEGVEDRAHAIAIDSQSRIVVSGSVGHARDWPLARGPFRAGERMITGIQASPNSPRVDGVVYYPAIREGENAPFANGGPFPLIGYAHGNRNLGIPVCPGTPNDFGEDFGQLSVIARHLARWGYVVVSSDQSGTILLFEKADILAASVSRMLAESEQTGSAFEDKIRASGVSLFGHSTGGGAAISVAGRGEFDLAAVATLAPGSTVPNEAATIGVPLLVATGSRDSSAVSGNPQQIFDAAVAPKHLVFITGANHFGFTDELCSEGDGPPTITREDQQRIGLAYATAFFQRYVRNETSNSSYLNGTRRIETLEGFGIDVEAVT